jgi:lipoate-protein ligase B
VSSGTDNSTSRRAVKRSCRFVSLDGGKIAYADGVRLQLAAHRARAAGDIGDTVYLLEHSPAVTLGRGASRANLLCSEADLALAGIDLIETDRGGDITYHGPGQLVGYAILDLNGYGRDLHRYLRTLELVLIDLLAAFGVRGEAVPGLTGVWTGGRKIAAIGIKVSRWVTMHGFSLNIDPDLTPMRRDIIPCGLVGREVTSLAELGANITRADCEAAFAEAFCKRFETDGGLELSTLMEELNRFGDADNLTGESE